MPISASCPACGSDHVAPDSAAGHTLPCRKCRTPVPVPAPPADEEVVEFEPVEEEAVEIEPEKEPTATTGAEPTRTVKPVAKKKKKAKSPPKKRGMSPLLRWGLIGGGAFLLLIAVGVGGYYALRSATPPPDKEQAGVGWYKTEDHDGWVTAYFPGGKSKYERVSFNPDNLAKLAGAKEAVGMGWRMETWERTEGKRKYSAFLFTLPSTGDRPKLAEDTLARTRIPIGQGVEVKVNDDVKVGAYPAKRVAIQYKGGSRVSLMIGIGGNRMAGVTVEGDDQFDHTDPVVAAFLENFTLNL